MSRYRWLFLCVYVCGCGTYLAVWLVFIFFLSVYSYSDVFGVGGDAHHVCNLDMSSEADLIAMLWGGASFVDLVPGYLARLKGVFYIALDDGSGRKYSPFEHRDCTGIGGSESMRL